MNDLQSIARLYEGSLTFTNVNEPGGGRASDYDWQEIPSLPLAHFGTKQMWIEHFNKWQPIYIEELGYDRFGEMVKYLETDPDDPIIAVRWSDGKVYLWDGSHRISASHVLNRTNIHAIFGTLKQTTPA